MEPEEYEALSFWRKPVEDAIQGEPIHVIDIIYPETAASTPETDAEDTRAATETTAPTAPTVAPVVADGTVMSYRDVKYRYTNDGKIEIVGYMPSRAAPAWKRSASPAEQSTSAITLLKVAPAWRT